MIGGPEDLSLGLQVPKNLKMVKILKVLFRDLLIRINQIDHDESEDHDPETLGSNFCDHGLKKLKKVNSTFNVHLMLLH